MSLKNVTDVEKNVKKIEFSCDKETFENAVNAVYKRNVKKFSVPGFRPGKAPKSFIEKMYGKGVFYEDAINDLIPAMYSAAIAESGLFPVSRPDIDIVSIDDDGLVLSAQFDVKPEISLEGYKGLTVKKIVKPVSDEDVDAEIGRVRERNARTNEVTDRAAKLGDTVIFDYSGSVDGVKFDGGTAENQSLELGSGHFIPGFEDQVAGKSIGEDFVVSVTFPEDYHEESLAGKAAEFACKIHSITEKELPELDDDFAADVSDFTTFDEYKADVLAKLTERAEHEAEHEAQFALNEKLAELVVDEIPASMIENQAEDEVNNYANRLASQGLSLDMYLKYTGMTKEQLLDQFKEGAAKTVKVRLALEKIAELENIEISDEELEKEYATIADMYKMELDAVKAGVNADDLKADLKIRAAMKLVEETAVYEAE